jgi:hypothetical protein
MMNQMRGGDEEKLDALFRAYNEACGSPEASPNFMPNLWARIESRQRFTFSFHRMATAMATAAVALSLLLGVYMAIPRSNTDYSQTYVEALAAYNSVDAPDIVGPVQMDLSERPSK